MNTSKRTSKNHTGCPAKTTLDNFKNIRNQNNSKNKLICSNDKRALTKLIDNFVDDKPLNYEDYNSIEEEYVTKSFEDMFQTLLDSDLEVCRVKNFELIPSVKICQKVKIKISWKNSSKGEYKKPKLKQFSETIKGPESDKDKCILL